MEIETKPDLTVEVTDTVDGGLLVVISGPGVAWIRRGAEAEGLDAPEYVHRAIRRALVETE